MAVTWITTSDVKQFLGVPITDTFDDAWLTQVTAASNDWCYRKRQQAGYDTDQPDIVPSEDVKTATILFAATLFRERGSVDQFSTFEDFQSATVAGGMANVNRLLGVPRAMAF
jgi:hypothetical protein